MTGWAYLPGSSTPYNGQASKIYDLADPLKMHLNIRYRKGLKEGETVGSDILRNRVYAAKYEKGVLVSENWKGEGSQKAFLNLNSSDLRVIYYAPAPPSFKMGHWLGTTPQGYDVLAYLYGGLQVNFKASLFFNPLQLCDWYLNRAVDGIFRRSFRFGRPAVDRGVFQYPVSLCYYYCQFFGADSNKGKVRSWSDPFNSLFCLVGWG